MSYVSPFSQGSAQEKDLLGGKGANLAEMTRMGLPVPPGFTITTAACRAYLRNDGVVPSGMWVEVDEALHALEDERGQHFGDPANPLLVSVRSGAPISMPGMMDTVLNVGLNQETVKGLAAKTEDERFAYDAYRRLIEMFGRVVLGVPDEVFERWRQGVLSEHGVALASDLDVDGLHDLVLAYRQAIRDHTGQDMPEEPRRQLHLAIEAVFSSWNGKRARDYRKLEHIPDEMGTAVNVQSMVFGNAGDDSGTGVAFTRNPATGERRPYGDFLVNAQGEDVVAGIRATEDLDTMHRHFPDCAAQLDEVMATLEQHYHEMCDIEFTIEHGQLFILQTRTGKRTTEAAVRMAIEMAEEGLIDRETAVRRVKPSQLDQLLHPRFAPGGDRTPLTIALNASPGAAVGKAVFTADDAEAWAERGEQVILVRPETSPDDLHGMVAAQGILTSRGGLVSHAAVVARGIGKPAVCGAKELTIDVAARRATVNGTSIAEGDVVSIDGATGEVFLGEIPVIEPEPSEQLETLLGWADEISRMLVRANADTGEDAARARAFGARGIGLCRTEHMFLGDRLPVVQRMILADTEAEEHAALAELHDVQKLDFTAILEAMDGLPVTVRLLDPPLHEFLPDVHELRIKEAREGELDADEQHLLDAALSWQEFNPMLGTRGCRLGIIKPHLYGMQVRALAEAAKDLRAAGRDPQFEVMIPLVSLAGELHQTMVQVADVLTDVLGVEWAREVPIGTMIETPRAALIAGELAHDAAFFSFGTNDLTQMTFGFSRDDVEGRLMSRYLETGILEVNPFQSVDVDGVGALVKQAVVAAKAAKAHIECGVCGEHGGDPQSVTFFDEVGLDYVSCSPFRVVVARLAAAHATLEHRS